MFRNVRKRTLGVWLTLVLLLSAVAVSTPLLAPATAVAQEEIDGVCDLYGGDHPTIQRGSTGEDVLHAQCLLNDLFSFQLDEDGIYGRLTEDAVATFQDTLGLEVDGIIGDCTWEALHNDAIPFEISPECFS